MIETVESVQNEEKCWDVKLAILERPDMLIVLKEPLTIWGIYGLRKRVKRIGLLIDDGDKLLGALTR